MAGRWSEQSDDLQQWRQALVDAMLEISRDTVIFSHFVAINAAVGAASGDDRVLLFRPDNGSITRIEVQDNALRVLERGHEAETKVN